MNNNDNIFFFIAQVVSIYFPLFLPNKVNLIIFPEVLAASGYVGKA